MGGYKCGLCQRWLASKYSLERHVRLKHKSDLKENTLAVKKHKLMQENNNTHSLDVKNASDQESDNNTELGHNNAGWVESDNKEELDKNNSEGKESNTELDNSRDDDNTQSDNNEELDNNKDSDNSKSEDAEEPNNNDLDYKHDLFDIAETSKEMC